MRKVYACARVFCQAHGFVQNLQMADGNLRGVLWIRVFVFRVSKEALSMTLWVCQDTTSEARHGHVRAFDDESQTAVE